MNWRTDTFDDIVNAYDETLCKFRDRMFELNREYLDVIPDQMSCIIIDLMEELNSCIYNMIDFKMPKKEN